MDTILKASHLISFSECQWSRDKVLSLIGSVEEFFDDFYDKSLKKKYIWNNVANNMSEKGYTCTGPACDKKWRDLKNSYAYALQEQREGHTTPEFEYFEALHHILGQEIKPDTRMQRITLEEEPDFTEATEFRDLTDDDGFLWDGIEVNLLLDCIMEFQEGFGKPDVDLNDVWEDIASQMSHVGEEVSSEQCQRKWLSLAEGLRVHQAQAEATGVVPLWPHYNRIMEVAEAVAVQTTFQIDKTIRVKSQLELCSKNTARAAAGKTPRRRPQRRSVPSKVARPRVGREHMQGVLARVKHIEASLSVRQRLERLEARVEASRQYRETTRKTNGLLAQVLAELRRINGALKQDASMGKVQVVQGQSTEPGSCSPKSQEFIIVEAYTDPL